MMIRPIKAEVLRKYFDFFSQDLTLLFLKMFDCLLFLSTGLGWLAVDC